MMPLRAIALAWGFVAALTTQAAGHADTQFTEYYGYILEDCSLCHRPGGGSNGALAPGYDEDDWFSQLVNAKATAADANGKLRIHPYVPWNSFLLEKLSGDVKAFEGAPMTYAGIGYVWGCPGALDAMYNWILAGASQLTTLQQGAEAGMAFGCDKNQPPFQGLAAPSPGEGVQISGTEFTLARPDVGGGRETEETYDLWTAASDTCVNRIEVAATAGTEYVTLTRGDDDLPFVVARGHDSPTKPRLREGMDGWGQQDVTADLDLPDGVALEIPAGTTIQATHRVRNDFWRFLSKDLGYANETNADLVVNLHTVECEGATRAEPLLDSTGTDTMFVPPRAVGASGGLWVGNPPAAVSGALVGIWSDARALEVGILDLAGQKLSIGSVSTCDQIGACPKADLARGYVDVAGLGLPAGTIAYECVHSNGLTNNVRGDAALATAPANNLALFVSRPQKYGCAEIAQVPAGLPGLVGEPAKDCHLSYQLPGDYAPYYSDCNDTATNQCRAANLVGGPGANDGRCSLIGLWW